MIDRFQEILQELSIETGLSLHPDHRGACKLLINELFHVQIEYQIEKQSLLIATFICEIVPGKFRENLLKAALKANHGSPEKPRLCYSEKNNELALFISLSLLPLTGATLYQHLLHFVEKANEWKIAINTGDLNSLSKTTTPSGKGMFGL